MRGAYRFTRNPVYLSGMVIWLGWVVIYGSVAVLIGFAVVWGSVTLLVVPWEERKLEARFGDAYCDTSAACHGGWAILRNRKGPVWIRTVPAGYGATGSRAGNPRSG